MKIRKNEFSGADADPKSATCVEKKDKQLCWTGTFFLDEDTGEGRIVLDDITHLLKNGKTPTLTIAKAIVAPKEPEAL